MTVRNSGRDIVNAAALGTITNQAAPKLVLPDPIIANALLSESIVFRNSDFFPSLISRTMTFIWYQLDYYLGLPKSGVWAGTLRVQISKS